MLLALLSLCYFALADTPAWCLNDQVLGHWEINVSTYDMFGDNDQIICPKEIVTDKTIKVHILSPNIVVNDETGSVGTWTAAYTQALTILIDGHRYVFYFSWENMDNNMIHSFCNVSQPGMGWAIQTGVTRPYHACIKAVNVKPDISKVDNIHPSQTELVVDGYHLHSRRLGTPVPYGPVLQTLHSEGKLKRNTLGYVPYKGDKLPKKFDWRNVKGKRYIPTPFDQGFCGSCYAASTVHAMMARVMVASNLSDPLGQTKGLSLEHVVDCNFYSQGCGGGFGVHVSMFAEEFGVLTNDSYYSDYVSGRGRSAECKVDGFTVGERYYFTAGQNIGGYMGGVTDPEEMKWELYRHGPFTVSVKVDDEGHWRSCNPYGPRHNETMNKKNPKRHYFIEEVNHEVVAVGWGQWSNGTEYWIIQNSWGPNWCGDGTIKVAMGTNEYGVESQPSVMYWWPHGPVNYTDATPAKAQSNKMVAATTTIAGVSVLLAVSLAVALVVVRRSHARYSSI